MIYPAGIHTIIKNPDNSQFIISQHGNKIPTLTMNPEQYHAAIEESGNNPWLYINKLMFWSIHQNITKTEQQFNQASWNSTTCRVNWATKGIYGPKNEDLLVKLRDISIVKHNKELLIVGTLSGELLLYRYPCVKSSNQKKSSKLILKVSEI